MYVCTIEGLKQCSKAVSTAKVHSVFFISDFKANWLA